MAIRIKCITKPQGHFDHSAIVGLGWEDVKSGKSDWITREDLWQWLTDKKGEAYTQDSSGNVAWLYPLTNSHGTRYVQTYADNKFSDNLL